MMSSRVRHPPLPGKARQNDRMACVSSRCKLFRPHVVFFLYPCRLAFSRWCACTSLIQQVCCVAIILSTSNRCFAAAYWHRGDRCIYGGEAVHMLDQISPHVKVTHTTRIRHDPTAHLTTAVDDDWTAADGQHCAASDNPVLTSYRVSPLISPPPCSSRLRHYRPLRSTWSMFLQLVLSSFELNDITFMH